MSKSLFIPLIFWMHSLHAQADWKNMDSCFGQLPQGFHVFVTTSSIDGAPFKAWYAEADLANKHLIFTTDTTMGRRLTPKQFHQKNKRALLVVNTSFFSFETNKNLNLVIKDGELIAHNVSTVPLRGKDTMMFRHPFAGAIGISKSRKADVAWAFTDSASKFAYASQYLPPNLKDSSASLSWSKVKNYPGENNVADTISGTRASFKKWKVQTAVGGGPVLLQDGQLAISNNEEMKFSGKALYDKHPRTAMGYTYSGKLIIMVIDGRNPGVAMGANLEQAAKLMQQLGCKEALNLDGGGSSCMLINGVETIYPSDKGEQRPVPAVFIINAGVK